MLRSLIQILAIAITLEAAIFLAKGNLGLTPKLIAELASTKWNYNKNVLQNLSSQKADTWIGVGLLVLAFALQLSNSLWEMRFTDFSVHQGGVVFALVLSAVIFVICIIVSKKVSTAIEKQAQGIIDKKQT